ncbi:PREDICTED: translation elongation factor Ts [Prunus dulcis]|uniref:Elongation factor Ts, mitochondrial n=2 Tax=Prunus dulcis TaxID=3755 RepID=A0A5E4E3Z9_PRUDU|nr:polyprotein of EF-Ts, chloroplastic [Prunus dulcis]VVA10534.1 PREDICTED: translation elongation factor Ts [Prunus dulcis]
MKAADLTSRFQVNMMPVIPYSISNVSHIPGTAFTARKNDCLTKFSFSRKSTRHTLSPKSFLLPFSTSIKLYPLYNSRCPVHHRSRIPVSATGTDVAVEEADSPVADAASIEALDNSSDGSPSPSQSRRTKPVRKSEMPPVKNEELVPGASFTGKVRSIQPFGAFIDIGAFTDGLVHVSQLSDSYVKDVGSVVSVGQEVKVTLVEANTETGRISLTMREGDDGSKPQQRKDASASSDRAGPGRRSSPKKGDRKNEVRKTTKFVKGQDLVGTVKNLVRAGAFISLPEGEEGFLPTSEEADDGFANALGETSLEVGQEVNVRVLRTTRGQVTLTMKKEEDALKSDSQISQGVVHTATNPFVLAFRENKDIASFLDEREKIEKAAKTIATQKSSEELEGKVNESESNISEVLDEQASSDEGTLGIPSAVNETVENDGALLEEADVGTHDNALSISVNNKEDQEIPVSGSIETLETTVQTIEKEEVNSDILAPEGSISTTGSIIKEPPSTDGVENDANADPSSEIANHTSPSESPTVEEVVEGQVDDTIVKDELQIQPPASESQIPSTSITKETKESQATKAVDDVPENIREEVQIQTPAAESELPSISQVEDDKVGSTPERNGGVSNSNGETDNPSPKESVTKETISPALVKQLREETGAGMMDCKNALSETGGDIVKAQEFLRKKGLASADKKASRATAEGRIGSYIHDSRIGILLEVNCETDFVSRGDIFKELVDDLAMQVAACPQVHYLATEDVPEEFVNKEREIEMQKEDLLSKPEQIRSKIVDGRIRKRLEELALLEQPYIKNDKVVVKDLVKQTIATIGENIKVKRFVRYNLGEGLEKKSQDFAAEVAAQTAAKPAPTGGKEQPAAVEAKETVEKAPTVAVSAALVKQLREETGAGMMDCKKALSETGGDLEKAQEYLRKKGLSSAEKKSSRLAAEGRIGSYIHDSRIGVLIEVNCETDFVGRSEKFKVLVDDLAMQVVACPQVQFVSIEDIPESIVTKEKELERQREDLLSKPENIRERIVEGRISKRLGELALLEQPFIKDDSLLVKDLVKQTVAALGENIKVRRFVRFTLGETVEDAKAEAEAEA